MRATQLRLSFVQPRDDVLADEVRIQQQQQQQQQQQLVTSS